MARIHRAHYYRRRWCAVSFFFLLFCWIERELNLKNGTLKVILTTTALGTSSFLLLFIHWHRSHRFISYDQLIRTTEHCGPGCWMNRLAIDERQREERGSDIKGKNMFDSTDGLCVCLHLQRQLVKHFTYVSFESSLERIILWIVCISTNKLCHRAPTTQKKRKEGEPTKRGDVAHGNRHNGA